MMSDRAEVLQEGIWRLIEAAAVLSMYKFSLPDRLLEDHDDAERLIIELIDRFYKLRGAVKVADDWGEENFVEKKRACLVEL